MVCSAQRRSKAVNEMRKGDGDDRPAFVLFVPSACGAEQRVDFSVSVRGEMETAVTGSRIEGHTVRVDGCSL